MAGRIIKVAALFAALSVSGASAQTVGSAASDNEILTELIGAPVFAADGPHIGDVTDVLLNEENQPRRLRMTAGAVLGLGERQLELPEGSFTVLRGAVVIDFPAEAVQLLPDLRDQEN
jgi:hypothetical protein